MNITAIARCVDQPVLLNKLQKKMPSLLVGIAAAYGIADTYKSSKAKNGDYKKKKALKNSVVISATVLSSLVAANGFKIANKQIIPRLIERTPLIEILNKQNSAVDTFLAKQKIFDKSLISALNKVRNDYLSVKEVDLLLSRLPKGKDSECLLDVILPKPENLNAKGIFSEIGRLSLLGAIPVIGGVSGGIASDYIVGDLSKKSTANKIKEGFYQYFANIFLCNVGACAALFIAEGLQKSKVIKPLSPLKKMVVILSGIVSTGIIGGSWIANKLSQKIIDPLFNKNKKLSCKGVYDERKPEFADVVLHADDIATAGVLSGFKWIEPALPIMYFVSGYRAGIGYRNSHSRNAS